MSLPFEGIRVADFGWIFAIPHATAWLGSLGAGASALVTLDLPDVIAGFEYRAE